MIQLNKARSAFQYEHAMRMLEEMAGYLGLLYAYKGDDRRAIHKIGRTYSTLKHWRGRGLKDRDIIEAARARDKSIHRVLLERRAELKDQAQTIKRRFEKAREKKTENDQYK